MCIMGKAEWIPFLFLLCLADANVLYLQKTRSNNVSLLRAHDYTRWSTFSDFPLIPTYLGIYFTKIKVGTPPKEFTVLIDSGSDMIWVTCSSCNSCPQFKDTEVTPNRFDPTQSSTIRPMSCSDNICQAKCPGEETKCSSKGHCHYSMEYIGNASTLGQYVWDIFSFDGVIRGSPVLNASIIPMAFGCSNVRTGNLLREDTAFDGIIGMAKGAPSLVSQLKLGAFSHCLAKGIHAAGFLVLGEVLNPNIVYTPMVPSRSSYKLNLQSIAVDGKLLPIDPSVFKESKKNHGTFIDSGTNFPFLIEKAFVQLVNTVDSFVPKIFLRQRYEEKHCYMGIFTSNISETFPIITLNFAGGASMVLRPEDYIFLHTFDLLSPPLWCVGFEGRQDITILGDLILQNKVLVYDLVHERIGWFNHNCSLPTNTLEVTVPILDRHHKNTATHLLHEYSILFIFLLLSCTFSW